MTDDIIGRDSPYLTLTTSWGVVKWYILGEKLKLHPYLAFAHLVRFVK